MTPAPLRAKLTELLALPQETEWAEFKHNNTDPQMIGDYLFRSLKARKLIEGRRPNLIVSAEIAAATETKAEYIKKRAFDKDHYKAMVIAYLKQFGEASRQDMDKLLLAKLSDALDGEQKRNFITNLLQEMRKDGTIRTEGSKRWAVWRLT